MGKHFISTLGIVSYEGFGWERSGAATYVYVYILQTYLTGIIL